jgi:hypothetical protein
VDNKHISKLPVNNIQQRLAAIQTALQQIKAAQLAGSSSVVLTRNVSGASPDFTFTSTYHVVNIWKVTFEPDDTNFADTGFIWEFFFDENIEAPNTVQAVEQTPTEQNVRYFYVMGTTSGESDTVKVTIVIYSIGGGTITIEQIA